jgi:hypothetical protein
MTMSRQRIGRADAAWLHMDRPTNLMVVNSLMLFEEPISLAQLAELGSRTSRVTASSTSRARQADTGLTEAADQRVSS